MITELQASRCFTCHVVGDSTVPRLAALTQTTIPLVQQADVVLRKACPGVPGGNCQTNQTLQARHTVVRCILCSMGSPLTLLGGIVLVGLAVPLPYIAIKIIEVVGGDVRNAVQLKEFSLCGQSPENKQQPAHDRQATGRSRAMCGCFCPPFLLSRQDAGGGPSADGRAHHSHGSGGGALDSLVGHARCLAVVTPGLTWTRVLSFRQKGKKQNKNTTPLFRR